MTASRTRRSTEDVIADLEAKIVTLRKKAELEKFNSTPALRYIRTALRSIDTAIESSTDRALKQALEEARASLNGSLPETPETVEEPRRARGHSRERGVSPDAILEHVKANPGQRSEQIAQALGTDSVAMRPVMKRLIEEHKVRTKGQKRGMTYSAM